VKENKSGESIKQLVISMEARPILKHLHATKFNGHLGLRKTLQKITQRFYRPGINDIVEEIVRECITCQKVKRLPHPARAALQPMMINEPLELITIDLVELATASRKGNKYVLVVCDHFTKFVQFYAIKSKEAVEVGKKLFKYICTYGIPNKLLSDQAKEFESELLAYLWEVLDIKKLRTSPYHPETDGLSERDIQSLLGMLRTVTNTNQDNWENYLDSLAYAYNSAIHATTNQTPYFLMFGRKPKMPIDLIFAEHSEQLDQEDTIEYKTSKAEFVKFLKEKKVIPEITEEVDPSVQIASQYAREVEKRLKYAYETLNRKKAGKLAKYKFYYDRKIKPFTYEEGDLVLKDKPIKSRNNKYRKLGIKFDGPYVVTKAISLTNYEIRKCIPGSRRQVAHHNRLKKYKKVTEDGIGCENKTCPDYTQWNHFSCVGIDENKIPEKWLCSKCQPAATVNTTRTYEYEYSLSDEPDRKIIH
jgi:hypothetical protein